MKAKNTFQASTSMLRWSIPFKGCMMGHRCSMMKWSHANLVGGVGNWVGDSMVYWFGMVDNMLGMVYRLYRVGPMFMDKMV
jgi:hypothetical protein